MQRKQICRILDANLDRAGEALRAMEDTARFGLNATSLSLRTRDLRHQLSATLTHLQVSPQELAAARDAEGDVGRPDPASTGTTRCSAVDVVTAASKRLQQALRCLEEYSKLISPESADPGFERIRYAAYTLEKDLILRLHPKPRLAEARLYLLLIGEVLPGVNHETALRAAIEGGAEIVQLREKGMPDRGFFHLAQRLRTICEDAGVLFLTNDRPHITVAVDADGVHLGAEDLPVPAARRILGPEKIIGATAHRIDEAIDGQAQGADYLGIGTMFPTTTKPGLEPHGCELFRELQGRVEIPVFAVGGITIENLPRLLAIGVRRVAVASGLLHAPDIRQRAAAFKRLLLEAP